MAASPTARSPPAARTWSPGLAALRMATTSPSPPPSTDVSSTITMASAPSGAGAPVMIRMASPGPTGTVGAFPAGSSATTRRRTGASGVAPAVSAARTA